MITDPKTTALLVLDLVRQGCNEQRRPRCLPTVASVHALLEKARAAGMPVVYSLVANSTAADVLKEVAPLGSEPMVTSGTDQVPRHRARQDLARQGHQDRHRRRHRCPRRGADHCHWRQRCGGFSVIVPVDGLSSESSYAEQYTVWNPR